MTLKSVCLTVVGTLQVIFLGINSSFAIEADKSLANSSGLQSSVSSLGAKRCVAFASGAGRTSGSDTGSGARTGGSYGSDTGSGARTGRSDMGWGSGGKYGSDTDSGTGTSGTDAGETNGLRKPSSTYQGGGDPSIEKDQDSPQYQGGGDPSIERGGN